MKVQNSEGTKAEAAQYTGEFRNIQTWVEEVGYINPIGYATDGDLLFLDGEEEVHVPPMDWLICYGPTKMDSCRNAEFKQLFKPA